MSTLSLWWRLTSGYFQKEGMQQNRGSSLEKACCRCKPPLELSVEACVQRRHAALHCSDGCLPVCDLWDGDIRRGRKQTPERLSDDMDNWLLDNTHEGHQGVLRSEDPHQQECPLPPLNVLHRPHLLWSAQQFFNVQGDGYWMRCTNTMKTHFWFVSSLIWNWLH